MRDTRVLTDEELNLGKDSGKGHEVKAAQDNQLGPSALKQVNHRRPVGRPFQYERYSAFIPETLNHGGENFWPDAFMKTSTSRMENHYRSIDIDSSLTKTGPSTCHERVR